MCQGVVVWVWWSGKLRNILCHCIQAWVWWKSFCIQCCQCLSHRAIYIWTKSRNVPNCLQLLTPTMWAQASLGREKKHVETPHVETMSIVGCRRHQPLWTPRTKSTGWTSWIPTTSRKEFCFSEGTWQVLGPPHVWTVRWTSRLSDRPVLVSTIGKQPWNQANNAPWQHWDATFPRRSKLKTCQKFSSTPPPK